MKTTTKRMFALTLAVTAGLASVTPSLARTTRSERAPAPQVYSDDAYGAYAQQYPRGPQSGFSAYGYAPGYFGSATQCWTDDGYGRRSTCDSAGGGN